MKKFNIVACIIVLLLAVVSAVFSYFLYEKRVQFVDGWAQLSNAIYESAKIIDSKSNKKFASNLTPEKLSHKTYSKAALADSLKSLTDQSKEFVKQYEDLVILQQNTQDALDKVSAQRDRMADTFSGIGKKTQAGTGNNEKFRDLKSYQGQIRQVSSKVNSIVDNRDAIARELDVIAKRDGGKIDNNTLFGGNARAGLAPIVAIINKQKSLRAVYAGGLSSLARRASTQFSDNGSKASVDNVVNAVNRKLAEVDGLRNDLNASRRENSNLKNNVKNQQAKIAELIKTINGYKKALGMKESDADPKFWDRGSVDARMAVVGKVTKVDDEYGYIVIDFGKNTKVIQPVGNKKNSINPDIDSGLSFNISRDDQFVATVTLSNVGNNESTANIPVDKQGKIKVGDMVTFKK